MDSTSSDPSQLAKGPAGEPNGERNPALFAAGVVLLIAALLLLLFGGAGRLNRPAVAEPNLPAPIELAADTAVAAVKANGAPQVGDVAPEFTAIGIEGEEHHLSRLRGQPVVVNFWATWCAPCRVEMPELQQAYEAHRRRGLTILAVNMGESADRVEDFFLQEMGLSFTPLLDEAGAVSNLYGAFNLPITYFIDREGVVTAIHRGPMVQSQIEGYLNAILPPL